MPDVFRVLKKNSASKLNGKTPRWFKDWHAEEFMEIKLRVTGLLWLVGMMTIAALSCFGIMLANALH